MRPFIITLLCSCIALFSLAQAPRLTRSQLKQATITDGRQPLSPASQAKPQSFQRVLKDRSLSLNDNNFKPEAPSLQLYFNDGKKIASVESYDFDWDSESAIAIVNDTTCALMGKYCSINDDVATLWYINDFYGNFSIPMNIDTVNRTVSIRAGVELSRILSNDENVCYSVLYAMPLSWLAGDSVYHDIQGVIRDDGSIAFADNFGFLVEKQDLYGNVSLSWALSPILTNLVLYKPNAIHCYQTESSGHKPWTATMVVRDQIYDKYPTGSGGSVPRPINPRPSNSSSIANTGSNKPITPPRRFQHNEEGTQPGQGSPNLPTRTYFNKVSQDDSSSFRLPIMRDVYINQLDDTTILVYNLYGSDYCWNYMRLFPDGTIFIPSQPMTTNSNDDVLVNCSKYHNETDTLVWGNYGFYDGTQIVWSDNYLCCNNAADGTYSIKKTYTDNSIALDSGLFVLPQWPCIAPVDLAVNPASTTASVSWDDAASTSWNLRYRPYINNDTIPVDSVSDVLPDDWTCVNALDANAFTIEGLDTETAYEVQVRTSNAGLPTSAWSMSVVFTTLPLPLKGDVNRDRKISIGDVTAMINYLLSGDASGIDLDAADCNHDGKVKIGDITALINYLLSGSW